MIRKTAVTLALLAALSTAACGVESGASSGDRAKLQRFCESRGGGVLSTDWHGDTVVCADQHVYDQP